MFILRDLLSPLKAQFSSAKLGQECAHWFVFTLLAVIVPFTSSMTSNLLRSLQTRFRPGSEPRALLRLHGLSQAAVGAPVARALEPDPRAFRRGTVIGGAG